MKSIKFILPIFLFSICAYAQVPGYMGKRIAIDVNFHSMANPVNTKIWFAEESGMRFRYKWNLQTDYVLTKKIAISLQYDLLNQHKTTSYAESGYRSVQNIRLQVHGIGIGYKKFLRGAMAPTGFYFHMNVMGIVGNFKASNLYTDTYVYNNEDESGVYNNDNSVSGVILRIGVGKRVVFGERYTFQFGISSGLGYIQSKDYGSAFVLYDPSDSEPHELAAKQALKLIKRNYGLNACIGFGILL